MNSIWAMVVVAVINGDPGSPYTTLFNTRESCEMEASRVNSFPPDVFQTGETGVLVRQDEIAVCVELFDEMLK